MFHSEYHPESRDGRLTFYPSRSAQDLVLAGEGFTTRLPIRIVIPLKYLEAVYVDEASLHLLLQLQHAPAYQVQTSASRVGSFDSEHKRIVPFTGHHFLLKFDSLATILSLFDAAPTLPQPIFKSLEVRSTDHFSEANLDALQANLASLPFPLSFQLDAMVHTNLLWPAEVLQLMPTIAELESAHGGIVAEEALIQLKRQLQDSRDRRGSEMMQVNGDVKMDAEGELQEAARVVVGRGTLPRVAEGDQSHFISRHVLVTPSGMLFEGPYVEDVSLPLSRPLCFSPSALLSSLADPVLPSLPVAVQLGRPQVSSGSVKLPTSLVRR